jgi:hypothetical protein
VTSRSRQAAARVLQLALAGLWLLDGVLQYQAFMFSKGFSRMLPDTAAGNPGVVGRPITWNASLVEQHAVLLNAVFATVQLLLGIGIAWRPAVRVALAASIAWSLGVWWFGEGLGMVLTGDTSLVNGAPGAVILYALLAVLLRPADRGGPAAPTTSTRRLAFGACGGGAILAGPPFRPAARDPRTSRVQRCSAAGRHGPARASAPPVCSDHRSYRWPSPPTITTRREPDASAKAPPAPPLPRIVFEP